MAYNNTLDHQAVVATVRAAYGPTPTKDECARICDEVATTLVGLGEVDAGLLRKTPPQNGGTLPDGRYVGKDVIFYRDSGLHFDCLVAAGAPGQATPSWQPLGFANIEFWEPPSSATPTPPDPPIPPTDLEARVARLEKHVADHARRFADIAVSAEGEG